MNNQEYPSYIELLKLRKAHPIFEMAALILGIDPRTLKIMPDWDPVTEQYVYLDDTPKRWFLPILAENLTTEDYLEKEMANQRLVPIAAQKLFVDLEEYKPCMRNELYQELKFALLHAVKQGEIQTNLHGTLDKDVIQNNASESYQVISESVKNWLVINNLSSPFFEKVTHSSGLAAIMDKNRSDHSPQLAIAVEAWIRFSGEGLTHPKKYIENWLDETYPNNISESNSEVGVHLSNEAKVRIAKVVNWNSDGGLRTTAYSKAIYEKAKSKHLNNK